MSHACKFLLTLCVFSRHQLPHDSVRDGPRYDVISYTVRGHGRVNVDVSGRLDASVVPVARHFGAATTFSHYKIMRQQAYEVTYEQFSP